MLRLEKELELLNQVAETLQEINTSVHRNGVSQFCLKVGIHCPIYFSPQCPSDGRALADLVDLGVLYSLVDWPNLLTNPLPSSKTLRGRIPLHVSPCGLKLPT